MDNTIVKTVKTVKIDKDTAEYINKALNSKDINVLGEDEAIVRTVKFPGDIEMDIKCCGVRYEDGGNNSAWTEAVLFHMGCEVVCSEPRDTFMGRWELPYHGKIYCADVIEGDI